MQQTYNRIPLQLYGFATLLKSRFSMCLYLLHIFKTTFYKKTYGGRAASVPPHPWEIIISFLALESIKKIIWRTLYRKSYFTWFVNFSKIFWSWLWRLALMGVGSKDWGKSRWLEEILKILIVANQFWYLTTTRKKQLLLCLYGRINNWKLKSSFNTFFRFSHVHWSLKLLRSRKAPGKEV